MVTEGTELDLKELILDHIGRYRLSFLPVMQRVYGELGNVSPVVRQLQKDGLIVARNKNNGYGSILGGYTGYQITVKGALRIGITEKRAKKLAESGLEISFRVLWLCCVGTPRYRLLQKLHLMQLFNHPLKSNNCPYCMELDGEKRVYRIRLLGQASDPDHMLRATRKDLIECGDIPGVAEFCQFGRYGNLLVVSKQERCKVLEQKINRQGLKELGHVRVAKVPDLAEIREAFSDRRSL